ncbi:translation elongation factor Ts (EF-Ts) [Thermodesulfitimonas autotrophica]|uniref:Elongation factor Ts n=1 Tax=Thermodesulfitimonas autotrophica TaxID=1894989 RepID=A0A3N5AXE6_9THEO|nr:translation elongation factor Ts [Thermodesulfitimonas autotrophica]RPF49699.1 translation elongation factor Ts (EF-Ts) [Thermodesulfitimonas autotrophica]
MEVPAKLVKELRERTGVGMMECKKALAETGGDIEKAIVLLRERGLAAAAKRAGRVAAEGMIAAYIHPGSRVGVLVEVNCETDFVAKTDDFKNFVHDVTLQIAASRPEYVSREDVPPEVIDREREILRAQARAEGKPEKVVEKMVEGRLEKFFKEACLLEQPFVKNPDITVKDLLNEVIVRTGENVVIRRFIRYELGEGVK